MNAINPLTSRGAGAIFVAMNTYTTQQVAEMTNKTPQAVRAWVLRHPEHGKMLGDIWTFSDADVEVIRALKPGPKPKPGAKPRARRAKPGPAGEPTP